MVAELMRRFYDSQGGGTTELMYGTPEPPLRRMAVWQRRSEILCDLVFLAHELHRVPAPPADVGVRVVRSRPSRDLRKISEETGGGYFELSQTADLAPTFSRVATELRSQYLVAFTPLALDGKVHKLEVRVNRPGMTVRARKSYLAATDRS